MKTFTTSNIPYPGEVNFKINMSKKPYKAQIISVRKVQSSTLAAI
jgi:hypothetical protein